MSSKYFAYYVDLYGTARASYELQANNDESRAPKKQAKSKKAAPGQKEMLMPIAGKKPAKETSAKKPSARQRKSA